MPSPNNVMEIYKILEKTNCRKCNESTCLAFAASVFQGRKPLSTCPYVDSATLDRLGQPAQRQQPGEQEQEELMAAMKKKIATVDFSSAAERLGGVFSDDKITIKCLGKDVAVDKKGNLSTDIHIHSWVTSPILDYILNGEGLPVTGNWVPLWELEGGATWKAFFKKQSEERLNKIADTHTDLFEILMHLFNGRSEDGNFDADISLVLYPLPKVPILICYWQPEEAFESKLSIYFDKSAEKNLGVEFLYLLVTGLVVMFEKIALRHGIRN